MKKEDITTLAVSLAGVLLLLGLMMIAPVYLVSDEVAERHFVWNAPLKPAAQNYQHLSPDMIRILSQDPMKRQVLEDLKNQPKDVPCDSNYLGPLFGHGFNVLGYLAALVTLGWLGFAGFKGYAAYMARVIEKREQANKKKSLPLGVKRMSIKRR